MLILLATPAFACMFDEPGEFVVDETLADTTPPTAPGDPEIGTIWRGAGPLDDGSFTSCDSSGRFSLRFYPATDDLVGDDDGTGTQAGVGYEVRLVAGTFADVYLFTHTTRAFTSTDGTVSIPVVWNDGGTDEQEPLDLTLGITAVDLAGNTSEEVVVDVHDPGRAAEPAAATGCGTPTSVAGPLPLLALALLGARRR